MLIRMRTMESGGFGMIKSEVIVEWAGCSSVAAG
jgi:hypothetical protein